MLSPGSGAKRTFSHPWLRSGCSATPCWPPREESAVTSAPISASSAPGA
jgi:hypothetical protein